MSTVIGSDPLRLIDFQSLLTDEEKEVQGTVRRFLDEEVRPNIADWFDEGRLPREVVKQLGGLGVLGMHLNGYGCAGTNAVSYGLACMELEAVDSGLRSCVSVQGSLAMFSIHQFGSDEQKDEWLPRMASGDAVGCFGLTEPDAGSDPSSMRTTARRDGSDWIIAGTKMWITNGDTCDVATVWARTNEGVRGFLVPRSTPGFTTRPVPRKLSLRASVTSELIFDDVRVPTSSMLPAATGLQAPLTCLNEARFGIIFGSMGAARDSLVVALQYSMAREQFGKPIAAFQLTQQKLVDMTVELTKGALLALHLGRLKDDHRITPEQVSLGKLSNVRAALSIARQARTVLGANGVTLDYSPLRHANNLESVLTYEGTSEIHTLGVGRALTGVDAYR